VKYSKAQILHRVHNIPELRFEDQRLSSFSGLVVIQALFKKLNLRAQLKRCFQHIQNSKVIGFSVTTILLIIHSMLGYRRLREMERYKEDPIVLRTLGLSRLPDVSTVSRRLSEVDRESIVKVREMNRDLVLGPLTAMLISRLTMDFDGSVLSTGRFAEGTAVGFNKQKKGKRSYYPLFCTLGQTGQVLDMYHRPGNVHDSNGAEDFILRRVRDVRSAIPLVKLEARLDSAFFADKHVNMLDKEDVEFTISVPFERFAELKGMVEKRKRWKHLDGKWSYFETQWSPKCWPNDFRFIFIRQKVRKQHREPIQLDLFIPHEHGYDFKVIVTNKKSTARNVLRFHNGRGAQENIFGELKSQCQMDYIPVRRLAGNQLYLMSTVLSHNLLRAMQMELAQPQKKTTEKRSPLWIFQEANTIRRHLLHRAGRLTRPGGKLRLTMSGNERTKKTFLDYLAALGAAA
jgi:hypothetical protein|tara:strand:+ start:164 stop:1540 length:1377 start_codon:yes stop_codon:yes gene_type:complete